MWCAQVAGENDTAATLFLWVGDVAFHIGRTEDVAGPLEADTANQVIALQQGDPLFIGMADEHAADFLDKAPG